MTLHMSYTLGELGAVRGALGAIDYHTVSTGVLLAHLCN